MEIPDGWRITKLRDLAKIKRGADSQYLTYVQNEDEGIRLIRISDFLSDKPKYVKRTEALKRFLLQENDLLIAGTGATAGITFEVPKHLAGLVFSYNAPLIRVNTANDKKYIVYSLKAANILRQQHGLFTGNAQPFLDTAAIGGFRIPLPPLLEQRRIAEILGTWDRAIAVNEELIAASEAQKKALMQQLLTGKRRLPGFDGEWKDVPLKEVFERVKTKNKGVSDNALTISAQMGLVSQEEFFNKRVAADNLSNYILLQKGDFAYNKSYSNGYPMGAIKPLELYENGVVSTLYICFRLKSSNDDHAYYRNYFEAGCFNREIAAFAQEGARNHGLLNIAIGDFFNGRICRPPSKEQKAIAEVLVAAESHLSAHQTKLQTLKTEKAALMQQLLTGKRRVKLTEAAAC